MVLLKNPLLHSSNHANLENQLAHYDYLCGQGRLYVDPSYLPAPGCRIVPSRQRTYAASRAFRRRLARTPGIVTYIAAG